MLVATAAAPCYTPNSAQGFQFSHPGQPFLPVLFCSVLLYSSHPTGCEMQLIVGHMNSLKLCRADKGRIFINYYGG